MHVLAAVDLLHKTRQATMLISYVMNLPQPKYT